MGTKEPAGPKRAEDESSSRVSRIPLKIGDDLIVRSLTNVAHRTRSTIIGARHGDFILISEPVVIINERISATIEEKFWCSYFTDGYLYNFNSRYIRHLVDDIVCVEYPGEIEVQQVRKHRRIRVNIETQLTPAGLNDTFSGDMVDISREGCRLVLHRPAHLTRAMSVSLVFSLPNEELVTGLQCKVRSLKYLDSSTTETGLSFTGPSGELAKVTGFCEFCMFFDLE